MPRFCTQCGHQNSDDACFCDSCGSPISASTQPAADVAPQAPNAGHRDSSKQLRRRWVSYGLGALAILCIGIGVAAFFAPTGPLAGLASTLRGLGGTGDGAALYYVGRNGKWGYINKAGSEVISFQYAAPPTVAGKGHYTIIRTVAPYPVFKNGKWTVVTRKGALLGQRILDEIQSIPQNPTVCGRVGKDWGCVDAAGRDAIPFKYEAVGMTLEELTAVKSNGRWGYLDKAGAFVIQPSFFEAGAFEHGLALVQFDDKNWGLIDATGKEVSKRRYKAAAAPGDGLWPVFDGANWVIADLSGEITQRVANMSMIFPFREGLAVAYGRNERLASLIDTSGKVVATFPFFSIPGSFQNGLAPVNVHDWNTEGFVRKDGRYVIPPLFDAVSGFVEGVAIVQKGAEAWTIDLTGRAIWPKEKQAIGAPTNDLGRLKSWKWRIQKMRSGGSTSFIGGTVEFAADTINIQTSRKFMKVRYESREAGVLRLTFDREQEPEDWEFMAYGDELVVFQGKERLPMLLTRAEPVGNERENVSASKDSDAQGKSLFSGLPSLFGRGVGGGAGNTSSMNACKSMVAALIAGDREAVQRLNHSSEHSWPTSHLMKEVSPRFQDARPKNITFTQVDDRTVVVRFIDGDPNIKDEWRFKFLKEKDGYFFVELS
jgi:hypothetical protein